MKNFSQNNPPKDYLKRKAVSPVICYPTNNLPKVDLKFLQKLRSKLNEKENIIIPPRDAKTFFVPSGNFFRIESLVGPQVGDLNLFHSKNLNEKFFSGKTRALHGTHVSTGDQLWSCFPYLRPMVTITYDTLDWYGWDADGSSVHDIIGTRCDPYTAKLLNKENYHYCCHSNLIRALVNEKQLPINEAEKLIHDVLNVFMCTGFSKDTHQYFMKASPVRPGDYIEFYAEIDILGLLSTCPGGDCGSKHSSNEVECFPLSVSVFEPEIKNISRKKPRISNYNGKHGVN